MPWRHPICSDRNHMHMRHCMIKWCALWLWCAAHAMALTPARQLSEYHKKYWQTEQNLPGNEVRAIGYSPEGRFLVGTASGLASFDGNRFLSPPTDGAFDLSKEWVDTFISTRDGSLWVATHDHG